MRFVLGPIAARGATERLRHSDVAPGTGTEARIARTTSPAVTPRSWASGASSSRCSSTAGEPRA